MKKIFTCIVDKKHAILTIFLVIFLICLMLSRMVGVNYDMNDYLPSDSPSTVAIDVMEHEFDGGIPNARVMVPNVTIPQALEYKEQIKTVEGVTDITWLDDVTDIRIPISILDSDILKTYYKDKNALFSVTIDEHYFITATDEISQIIGAEGAMSGNAVSTAAATTSTVVEVRQIAIIAVIFVLIVLTLTTKSWIEPIIILCGLGLAIVINSGTNLIFGEISFVTNAAGSILQLAVSLDYSVFLIHRFEECRKENPDDRFAMIDALCKSTTSILSSGLTTVIGFLALVLMRFKIGPDLGLALAKGVAISLITVFIFMPAFILTFLKWIDKTNHKKLLPDFHKFGMLVRRISMPMIFIFFIVIVPSYIASNSNDYYYGASNMFDENSKIGADTITIENTFGKNDTYVLLVPSGDTATETNLSNELNALDKVTSILSYVDMAGAEIPMEYLDDNTLSQLVSNHYSRMVINVDVPYEGKETFELIEQIRKTTSKYYSDSYYLAGAGVSTYDLMDTVTADMLKVNLVAIGAVFFILLLTLRSVTLPVILVLSIETAIWLNLSVPYFAGSIIFYIAYLIISSIQLGATVDYAILMTDRYKENRMTLNKKDTVIQTISDVTISILTSGSVLTVVGLLLGYISSNQLLAQLGIFIGRGAIFSLVIVLFVLPGLLYLFDSFITGDKKTNSFFNKIGGLLMKNKRKKITKLSIFALITALSLSLIQPALVSAFSPNTPKEEVVYINLNSNGSVSDIYVVNIFELTSSNQIIDYGQYESLRNMTTTDSIDYSNHTVTISSDSDKLYYEGKLDSNIMPWDILINYYMDDTKYPANEIAGMTGKLKIEMSIRQNTKCDSSFFEGYALQASLTLDSEYCTNITSDNASIANVGSNKQLTYTILPGKETDIEITADVKDFEMNGFSINAIPLSLDIEIDDSELMNQVTDLLDAIEQLDDGAGELMDGTSKLQNSVKNDLKSGTNELLNGANQLSAGAAELKNGGDSLRNGSSNLSDGTKTLDTGVQSLNTGIKKIQAALHTLNKQSSSLTSGSAEIKNALSNIQTALNAVSVNADHLNELTTASKNIKSGIDTLVTSISTLKEGISFSSYKGAMQQNGLDIDTLKQSNSDAVSGLRATISSLNDQIVILEGLGNDTSQLSAQILQLENTISLLEANNSCINGTDAYLTAINSNIAQLLEGAKSLQTNYAAFDLKIDELVSSLNSLGYNMSQLSTAISTLVEEYSKLDKGINDYTSGVAKIVSGYSQITKGSADLVTGSSELKKGSEALYGGASELLSGIVKFYEATGSLTNGSGALDEGVAELLTGIAQLQTGTEDMKNGTKSMRDETDGMDRQIDEKIDNLMTGITGENTEIISFVSRKNTNIDAVQFVIKSESIEIPDLIENESDTEENMNFWNKLLNLFGIS